VWQTHSTPVRPEALAYTVLLSPLLLGASTERAQLKTVLKSPVLIVAMTSRLRSLFFCSELLASVATYLVVVTLLFAALLAYRLPEERGQAFRSSTWVLALSITIFAAISAVVLIVFALKKSAGARRKQFWVPVTAHVLVICSGFMLAEFVVRAITKPGEFGKRIGSLSLVPYDWSIFAATNLEYLKRSHYYIEDSLLGYTIAPDSEGHDGTYKSSIEGLRSEYRGESLASRSATQLVALFGDSFTFGEDVPFQETWANYLQQRVSSGVQIINFGVPGYGVDQAYLRYKRDGAKWPVSVAVLAFIQADLYRNVSAYMFLHFDWQMPFSKPIFSIDGSDLRLATKPTLPAEALFSKRSIAELPFLEYDINFDPQLWTQHPFYNSYLVRAFASRFSRWPRRTAHTSDDVVVQVGTRLIEAFVGTASARNARAIVLYLPSRNDFVTKEPLLKWRVKGALAAKGVELYDLTECLTNQIPAPELFIPEHPHYTGRANAAVASCVQPLIASLLSPLPRERR